MKYAIFKCINGNFSTDSEWNNLDSAIVQFHGVCRALWNDAETEKAMVEIVDEDFNVKPGYYELIQPTRNVDA